VNALKKSSGMTLIGFIFVMMIIGLFAYAGFKLVPNYIEFQSVKDSMKTLKAQWSGGGSPARIKRDLDKIFYTSYVDSVKPEHIKIVRGNGGYIVKVKYDVREPFIGNLDFLMHFENQVTLR